MENLAQDTMKKTVTEKQIGTSKRLLMVVPDFPYPANHGGRVDIWGRLKALAQLGYTIDLAIAARGMATPNEVNEMGHFVDDITIIQRDYSPQCFFRIKPFQVTSRSGLRTHCFEKEYDIALLESFYVLDVVENPTFRARKVICKVHNHEARYFWELSKSTSNILKKAYFISESIKMAAYTKSIPKRARTLFFSSVDECAEFSVKFPELTCRHIGGALGDDKIIQRSLSSETALFIGSLFMANNREAVEWYVKRVHPLLLKRKNYKLLVVGNTLGAPGDWLSWLENIDRVKLIQNAQNLDEYYEEASVFVNSMQHGTSIKMKTIEAIRNGLPVVSTSVGNMGTLFRHGHHIWVENDPVEFSERIHRLLDDRNHAHAMVSVSQEMFEELYNHKIILEKMLQEIDRI
jgi:glycosyltransferase involved in cell wall biosynthesis